jgi:NAD(P)-dependent dehydrogenase (short-subunit alcohol dehydrogenase family)
LILGDKVDLMNKNRVALVTNAREFAGLGSVAALLENGFAVVGHDKPFVDEESRERFSEAHVGATPLSEQAPLPLVREIQSTHQRVDVLVSNDVVPGGWEAKGAMLGPGRRRRIEAACRGG